MDSDVIVNLLNFQSQLKLFHWCTSSNSKHLAYETLYNEISDEIDKLVEASFGEERIFGEDVRTVKLTFGDQESEKILIEFYTYFNGLRNNLSPERQSIVDNIQVSIKQCLFRLKLA